MPKNIVVFADGTGQEGGRGNNTNVYDLFNVIEERTQRQISYYDKGLGTGWRKVTGNISGAGISKNVKECYEFIFSNYDAGDQVYLIGFSRGAATVRTLAAFIHRFGILPQSRPELIDKAWSIYKIRGKDKRRKKAEEFIKANHTMWARIRFVGVWDTVAALGLPWKVLNTILDRIPFFRHSFHDLRLAKSVDYARHALAIDDEREVFHPTLWDEKENDRPTGNVATNLTPEDVTDVYSICEKIRIAAKAAEISAKSSSAAPTEQPAEEEALMMEADPLSEFLEQQFRTHKPRLLDLILQFDTEKKRTESEDDIDELQVELASTLNKLVINKISLYKTLKERVYGDHAYNPQDSEKLAGITLSEESRELITLRKADGRLPMRKQCRLNRLILEDAYSLKRMTFPRIKQVWFAGMHTDVGGGYAERGLSHIPLLWMLNEAMILGLLIFEEHKTDMRPDPRDRMHDSREKWGKYVYRRKVRSWNADKNRGHLPLVHESVLLRNHCEDLAYEPWILKMKNEIEPWPQSLRSSVQYDDHYIWREAFWGWGGAFTVDWNSVQHITFDEMSRTLTLHLYERDPRDHIVVKGYLTSGIKDLLTEFSRRRAEALDNKEDRDALNEVVRVLTDKIKKQDDEIDRMKQGRPPSASGKGA